MSIGGGKKKMDLGLTKEQVMVRETARELATKEIALIAAENEETGRFPHSHLWER